MQPSMPQDLSDIYAYCISGLLLAILAVRLYSRSYPGWRRLARRIENKLDHRYILRRHSVVGPWNALSAIWLIIYISLNVTCLAFRTKTLLNSSGAVALANLLPLFLSIHLDYLADHLGVSLKTIKLLHRSFGWMSSVVLGIHIASVYVDQGLVLHSNFRRIAIFMGSVLLWLACLLSYVSKRFLWYEVFLRGHFLTACLIFMALWLHIDAFGDFPKHCFYGFSGLFLVVFVFQAGHMIYQNRRRGSTFTRALIYNVNEGEIISRGVAVRVRVILSRPIKVEPGQYICLWIPRVRLLESHPFVVASWMDAEQTSVELFIQPRTGFTSRLLCYRQEHPIPRLAMMSGPHGLIIPVLNYEAVVLIATDFGIAAQIAYLQRLVHGYNYRKGVTRRVRLIWMVNDLRVISAAQWLLNPLLSDDTWNEIEHRAQLQVLNISIYGSPTGTSAGAFQAEQRVPSFPFGKRAIFFSKAPDVKQIILDEASEMFEQSPSPAEADFSSPNNFSYACNQPQTKEERGNMLILSSCNTNLKDRVRNIVATYKRPGFSGCRNVLSKRERTTKDSNSQELSNTSTLNSRLQDIPEEPNYSPSPQSHTRTPPLEAEYIAQYLQNNIFLKELEYQPE